MAKIWVHITHKNASPVVFSHQDPPTYLFKTVFTCKWCLLCAYFSSYSVETVFFTGEINMDRGSKLKHLMINLLHYKTYSFLLHKTLLNGLDLCELLVGYCGVFITCLDSHSDGTHSLQRIHCWSSDVMQNFSKSVLMKKQTHFGWPEGKCIFERTVTLRAICAFT